MAALDRLGLSENGLLLVFGVVIGASAAGGVIVFYRLIDLAYLVLYKWTPTLPHGSLLAYRPLLTGIAFIMASVLMRRMAPGETGFTVPDVQLRVARQAGDVPLRGTLARTVASAVTIGGGGSAGSEGPVAVLGAGLASAISRWFRFAAGRSTVLVAAGVAAGISAAFNAPLAGAFFALEEILGTLSVGAFPCVVVASVVAAVVSRAAFGNHPAFPIPEEYGFAMARELLVFYPVLGLLAGYVGAYFVRLYFRTGDVMAGVRLPAWALAALSGMAVGSMVLLSDNHLLGSGHLAFDLAALSRLSWYALAGLAVAKMLATAITLQGGGSGGLFTPTLFVGGVMGASAGALLQQVFPASVPQAEPYALVGMGALVASALGAPLTGVLLVFEITNDYAIMLPLMGTVAISAVVARRLERDTLYSGWLRRRGEVLEFGASRDLLARLRVVDAFDQDPVRFMEDEALPALLERMATCDQEVYPVTDREGTCIGVVTIQDLARLARTREVDEPRVLAGDLATASEMVHPIDSLHIALRRLGTRGVAAIPVVREDGRLIGLLSRGHILAAYDRALLGANGPLTG